MFKKKNVVNNVDMSSLRAKITKWPVQKINPQNNTKTRRSPRRNRHLEEKKHTLCLCFS